jgi:hypothetical protein
MADKKIEHPRSRATEFVRIGDQHVALDAGVLKIGGLGIDLHHPGVRGVAGLDAYCCNNDFGACVPRTGGQNCADTAKPITVWKFVE